MAKTGGILSERLRRAQGRLVRAVDSLGPAAKTSLEAAAENDGARADNAEIEKTVEIGVARLDLVIERLRVVLEE